MSFKLMLDEMCRDIDAVAFRGGIEVPYIGWNLRRHYGQVIRDHGIAAATADATTRYRRQAECAAVEQLPDLSYPCLRVANTTYPQPNTGPSRPTTEGLIDL